MSTQVETSKALEVAHRLVDLCREGKNVEAINELYDDNIICLEPEGSPAETRTVGKDAALGSTNYWYSTVEEIHSAYISDPLVAGNFFACTMDIDATYKKQGRMEMSELGIFEVKNGKIVSSQFFYNTGK